MTIQFKEDFYICGTRFSAAKSLMVRKKSSWILTLEADSTIHDTLNQQNMFLFDLQNSQSTNNNSISQSSTKNSSIFKDQEMQENRFSTDSKRRGK